MKKQLLVGAMLMGAFFTANAQYATSFTAEEGYEAGPLDGQNDWTNSTDELGVPVAGFDITTEDGMSALMVSYNENFASSNEGVILGAFSPAISAFPVTTTSFDVMIMEDEDEETFTSNYALISQSNEEELLTSWVEFNYEGEILINEGATPYTDSGATWTAGEWMQIDVTIDTEAGTIVYKLNGEIIHEGEIWGGTSFDQVLVFHDNWNGSSFFVDGIDVVEGSTAGTNDVLASKFSVFPNPANDVINIANAENMLVNGVTIADINGRTVKSAQFAGVTNATVNVSDLASGVYMMTVSSDKGTATKKIVKN